MLSYREELNELVRQITPLDAMEEAHKDDTLQWIESGAKLCRIAKPATPPRHLVSYFTLLDLERERILLVDHKRALLWLPSSGHVEPGEHPADAAHRELKEELGVSLPLIQPTPLFLTVTQTQGLTAGHTDVSLWYAFEADSTVSLRCDADEFHQIRWFPLTELPLERTDPHLERFVQKLHTSVQLQTTHKRETK